MHLVLWENIATHMIFFFKSLNVISIRVAGSDHYKISRARVFLSHHWAVSGQGTHKIFLEAQSYFLTNSPDKRQIWGSSTGSDQVLALDCGGESPSSRFPPPALSPGSFLCQSHHCILPSGQMSEIPRPSTNHFDRKPFIIHKTLAFSLALT